jgi:drug/metabolite transporter (DMT)-like permease
LRPVGFVYLGVMVLTWAGNWPLMKLALGQVPPLVFVLFRLIGSLALIEPCSWRGSRCCQRAASD